MHIPSKFNVPALTIAKYTVKGYLKERILLVVLVFGFLLMVASYVLAPLAVGAQKKIIVDIGLGSVSIFGVLLVILMGAGSHSREREKGILSNILSKPISRVDFILGKFLGTWFTITVIMACMSVVYLIVMVASQTPFNKMIFIALHLSVVEVALITAVLTLFSTFTSPLLSSLFTLCVFICGHLSGDLLDFASHFGGAGLKLVSSIGYYLLPNLALFNVRSEAVHNLPLMDQYVYSATIYALFYVLVLLLVSSIIFKRRDIVQ